MSISFDKLNTIVIKNKDVISFFENNKLIQLAFQHNGWIAGGFPREIFKLEEQKTSFSDLTENYFFKGGDIDFFFKSNDAVVSLQDKFPTNEPLYGGSHNFALSATTILKDKLIVIQFVNKFFYSDVKETFQNFDFYNSCYAIQKVNDDYLLTYLDDAVFFDQKKVLSINNSNSPFTIQRITKYMSRKNLDTIDDQSIEKLTDLIYKIACESFDSKYKFDHYKKNLVPEVKYAFERFAIDPAAALLFLGKFKDVISDGDDAYGPKITVDWAVKFIQNCVK